MPQNKWIAIKDSGINELLTLFMGRVDCQPLGNGERQAWTISCGRFIMSRRDSIPGKEM